MKTIKYLFILTLICFFVQSCEELLEKTPLDIISDDVVFNDVTLANSYLANCYGLIKGPSTFQPLSSDEILNDESLLSGEGSTPHTWTNEWNNNYLFGALNNTGGLKEYWGYDLVRKCNFFIESMAASTLDESVKKELSGQMRMIRAVTYFEMVKRYGGIPLITKAQSVTDPESELFAKRNKEQEIYDFIGSEVDAVLDDLPVGNVNRFTKYGALALKSRAMLYAGSIAKYGTVQLDGVVGIPSNLANAYFQASYDASKQIIPNADGGSGGATFSLYKEKIVPGDLDSYAKNYNALFVTEKNCESIFEVDYIKIIHGNVAGFGSIGAGTMIDPAVDFVNAYEMADGSSGVIDFTTAASDNVPSLFVNKDPRFRGSILVQGDLWNGKTIGCQMYIIKENGEKVGVDGEYYTGLNGFTILTKGAYRAWTGFMTKKMTHENGRDDGASPFGADDDVPCLYFRLGEIYLNCAEAAQELGNSSEALKYVNLIRERAGIFLLSSVDMAKVKQERRIELALGEAHRWWDLRRWRDAAKSIAEGGLNGFIKKAEVYYDFRDHKYHFNYANAEPYARVFKEANYYLPIAVWKINNNPNLVQNPGY